MAKDKIVRREKVRFYRGKLPTIVWDARNNRALVDLSEGQIVLTDPYAIEVMRKIGYQEISLDATRPPEIEEPIQPENMPDVRPIPTGLTEQGAAKLIAAKSKTMVEVEDDDGPAVPAPKLKNTPSEKPKKTRGIKRRK